MHKRGIGFRLLHKVLDANTPGGCLVFRVFHRLAEFIRELIIQGAHEGLGAACSAGSASAAQRL
ncbi:recombinase family protein [Nocardia sp. NPDC004750]